SSAMKRAQRMHPRADIIDPFRGIPAKILTSGTTMHGDKEGRDLVEGELEELLDACYDCQKMTKIYMPLIIFLAVQTGMRKDELFRLKRRDINNAKGYIEVFAQKTSWRLKGKNKVRLIPLTNIVERSIDKLESIVGKLNPGAKIFGEWSYDACTGVWRDLRDR